MKKILSMMTVVIMLATLWSMAFAEEVTLDDYGLSLTIPDGMTLEDKTSDPETAINLLVTGGNLQYTVTLAYDKTMAGKTVADLTEEEVAAMSEVIAAQVPDVTVEVVEDEEGGAYFVAANEAESAFILAYVEDGVILIVSGANTDGALSEENMNQVGTIIDSLTFVEDDAAGTGEETGEEDATE